MGPVHRKCTLVGPNCRDQAISNWNVSSVVTDRKKAGTCLGSPAVLPLCGNFINKTRGSGTVNLNGGWRIFYLGVDAAISAQAGVAYL